MFKSKFWLGIGLILFLINISNLLGQCRPIFYTGLTQWGFLYNAGDSITRVQFHTLNNYSGNTSAITDSVYSDYTNLSTSVCRGATYPLTVWAGDTNVYRSGTIAWIDFNGNGSYETSEMVLRDSASVTHRSIAAQSQVTIPVNAVLGTVTMRVLSAFTYNTPQFPGKMPPNDACYAYNLVCVDSAPSFNGVPYPDIDPGCFQCISCQALTGEFEEYSIVILPSPSVIVSGGANLCSGQSTQVSFQFSGASPWNFNYTDGVQNYTQTGITSTPFVISLTPTASRTWQVTGLQNQVCSGIISGVAPVNVYAPTGVVLSGSQTICSGATQTLSFALTGASPWTLTWSDGTTPTTQSGITQSPYLVNVSPTVNTTYLPISLSGSCGSGGINGSANVQISNQLSALMTGPSEVCSGNGIILTFTISGASPYQLTWTDGSTQQTLTRLTQSPYYFSETPLSSRTYSWIQVSNACVPAGQLNGQVNLTVHSQPGVTFPGGAQYFCNQPTLAESFTLTGVSPWQVTYTDGTQSFNLTGITTTPFTYSQFITHSGPSDTLTYTPVQISDAHCTQIGGSGFIRFIQDFGPQAVLSGTQTVCAGQSASLSILGTSGYQPWDIEYDDGTVQTTITGITSLPYIFSVTPTAQTTYTVTSLIHSCPQAQVSGTPVVSQAGPSNATLTGPSTICTPNAGNLTIQLTGNSPWTINYSDGTSSLQVSGITSSPYLIGITPLSNTTYTLQNVAGTGCLQGSASGTVALQVNHPVQGAVSGRSDICPGDTVRLYTFLQGTTPWSFQWSDGVNTQSVTGLSQSPYIITLTPSTTRTYTFTGLQNQCGQGIWNGTQPRIIQVRTPLSGQLSGPSSLCFGQNAMLTLNISGGTPPWSFSYSDGSTGITQSNVTASPFTIPIQPSTALTYTLLNLQDNLCSGNAGSPIGIWVNSRPQAQWSGGQAICTGDSIIISAPLSGQGPWDLTWTDGTTQYSDTGINNTAWQWVTTPTNSTTYSLVSIQDALCENLLSQNYVATVNPIPTGQLLTAPNLPLCAGSLLQLSVITTGTPPYTVTYSDGISTQTFTGITASPGILTLAPQQSTTYSLLQVQDQYCSVNLNDTLWVPVVALPTLDFSYTPDLNSPWIINFATIPAGLSPILWDFGDGTSSTLNSVQHTYTPTGGGQPVPFVVTLTLTDYCGVFVKDTTILITPVGLESEALPQSQEYVYPNPITTESILNIKSRINVTQIEITDVLGRIVYHEDRDNPIDQVNLSSIPIGSYQLKISDKSGVARVFTFVIY
ncbi:MAG: T9SS C-terminal target domain-containing protein [Sphingobacteriia bacterium]|nr:T9SS C-terminal target domain-containing protein [Sphingobacteriia bacterium]